MRCRECAAEVAVTARVCSRCGVPIVGQPTGVGAVIRYLRESYEGTNVGGVVVICASALVGIFFILVSVGLYVDNRDLAAHGVRTQGQVVYADADGSDEVVYTVDGTDYEVPDPEVGDRLPGDAVTVVYDPRDPSNSNLEDDSVRVALALDPPRVGAVCSGAPRDACRRGGLRSRRTGRPQVGEGASRPTPAGDAAHRRPGRRDAEPFVPGSGEKLPAELRLVLGGYAGIACGWFAGALACAAAVVFVIFDADIRSAVFKFFDVDIVESLFLAIPVCGVGLFAALMALETLQARIRFSRLLRRPSDPQTATVTASKRDGRTVILDILRRDGSRRRYQSLSEVGLVLWLKAGMLVPGETVNVYGGSGGASELLITSPRWGRAFLGTVTSESTVQRGPVEPLDEKVSGATLIDWAAWAAATTFSSTGRRFGYDIPEVDAFRSAVRDTFLGGAVFWVSTPPVRSDDLRGKQFSTHRPGYDKTQVAAFLDAAGIRLAAMESTGRPAGPLVSGAFLAAWAEWADSTTFDRRSGYTATEVDSYLRAIRDTFLGVSETPVRADNVRGKQFPSTDEFGYDKTQVDAFLDAAGIRLAAMEVHGHADRTTG